MAKNNAINTEIPLEVEKGGTGASSFTSNGLLVGSGTAAITALSVGSTGELLVGASGANPAFSTSADGNFAFTSATSGVDRILTISNTSNTASSAATVLVSVGGSGSGDPVVRWQVTGHNNYYMGIDNDDTDALKISYNGALGGTDLWKMTINGERTLPKQPAFSAYLSSTQSSVTGNGTNYTIPFDTEIFDQASNYNNSTGVFTAPVTGRYFFSTCIHFISNSSGGNQAGAYFITSNRSWCLAEYPTNLRCSGFYGPNSAITYSFAALVDMDAADTCYVRIYSENGSLLDSIYGTTSPYTCFSGYLTV